MPSSFCGLWIRKSGSGSWRSGSAPWRRGQASGGSACCPHVASQPNVEAHAARVLLALCPRASGSQPPRCPWSPWVVHTLGDSVRVMGSLLAGPEHHSADSAVSHLCFSAGELAHYSSSWRAGTSPLSASSAWPSVKDCVLRLSRLCL